MRKFLRVLKKILLYGLGSILGLLIIALVLSYVFEDKIKAVAVQELNKHLQAEVIITTDDIHFSLIKNFPNASLAFENFKIRESYPGSKTYFAEVGRLSLIFNPLDLLNGKYKISRIELKDADIQMHIDALGRENYLFWKSSEPSTAGGSFSVDLKHISLRHVKYSYADEEAGFSTATNIDNATLSGHFSDVQYDLTAEGDLLVESMKAGSIQLMTNKQCSLKTVLAINSDKESYTIRNSKLKIDKASFDVSGMAANKPDWVDLDFNVKGDETDIQTLLSLLPEQWAKPLADYESEGKILFLASVKGKASGEYIPAINVNFGISNGTIKEKGKSLALQNVNFKGMFTNGVEHSNRSSILEIEDFKATLNNRDISGSCKLQDLDNPFLLLSLKGNVDLKDVKEFANIPSVTDLSGELSLDASFRGRIKDLQNYSSIGRTAMAGKMMVRNVSIQYVNQPAPYSEMNGQFIFDGNNLLIDAFSGKFANTDFLVNGAFKNLASYLFLPNQQLIADASLQCHLFRLDDFMTESSTADDTSLHFAFPAFLVCDMRLQAAEFEYGKLKAANLTGRLVARDKIATLTDIHFNTMSGDVTATGQIQQMDNGELRTYVKADLSDIDVSQLFFQMDNFGQNYFTDKHIKGNMKAHVEYNALWKPSLDADLPSIAAKADISIDKGEIAGFDPLVKMGKFLKVNSLDDLVFDRLSNSISIQNQKISIPRMDLSSNAMNMSLAGTHTFDNIMDYKMKLNISQLLFGKKKDYESEFGPVEVDENGGLNLFLSMTGPGNSPKIAYDRKASVNSFKEGLKQEKNDLKNVFTGNKAPDGSTKEDLNKPQNGFTVSFDEDDNNTKTDKQTTDTKSEPSQTDIKRKKAFEDLKKKLSNKPE